MSGTKTGINWIGLYTIVRREVSRMMRVPIQAFIAPWISALLFIFIFGYVVGGRISSIGGVPYIRFVLPGILMMNIVNASFLRFIEETLVSPMSYTEMVAGSLVVVVVRSTVTALGILVMGLAFGATTIQSIPAFLYWVVAVSMIFGLMGIVIGLWSKSFEQLNVLTVFFITPLSMVGGVFNTVDMLPPWLRFLAWGNPFFYFINGIRHSMIGFSETPAGVGYAFTTLLAVAMFLWVLRLYSRGYGLRE
jgi:ABC-2 type transport system permease protein